MEGQEEFSANSQELKFVNPSNAVLPSIMQPLRPPKTSHLYFEAQTTKAHSQKANTTGQTSALEGSKKDVPSSADRPTSKRRLNADHRTITVRRRSTSFFDSEPVKLIKGMETNIPNIPTKNCYSIFADCHISNDENTDTHPQHIPVNTNGPDPANTKPPPLYVHGQIDHYKLLEALKAKYQDKFQVKFTSGKLKIMFQNIIYFKEFKEICHKENIQYHTYAIQN